MREILFRGKRSGTGEWVKGYYVKHINRTPCPVGDRIRNRDVEHLIFKDGFSDWNMPRGVESYQVAPKTVGQYIGIKDKKGTPIFEGDFLFTPDGRYQVVWNEDWLAFEAKTMVTKEDFSMQELSLDMEVIGNIYDNPELLGEG